MKLASSMAILSTVALTMTSAASSVASENNGNHGASAIASARASVRGNRRPQTRKLNKASSYYYYSKSNGGSTRRLNDEASNCVDDPEWHYRENPKKTCFWLNTRNWTDLEKKKWCKKRANTDTSDKTKVSAYCKAACKACPNA